MEDRFIPYLKSTQPAIWQALLGAARDGLVIIDEENDALSATNRLLFTYPALHEILQRMTDDWAENHVDSTAHFKALVSGASGDVGKR